MKQCLLRNNGLELEGIFEENGDEVITKKMRQRLNLGHELIIEEPSQLYCVAGLLKVHWYNLELNHSNGIRTYLKKSFK